MKERVIAFDFLQIVLLSFFKSNIANLFERIDIINLANILYFMYSIIRQITKKYDTVVLSTKNIVVLKWQLQKYFLWI